MIFEEIGSLFVNVAALSDWRYWVMWLIGGCLFIWQSPRIWNQRCCCRWALAPF